LQKACFDFYQHLPSNSGPLAANNHGSESWGNFQHINSFMALKLQKRKIKGRKGRVENKKAGYS
jgi:hypothetical protein